MSVSPSVLPAKPLYEILNPTHYAGGAPEISTTVAIAIHGLRL